IAFQFGALLFQRRGFGIGLRMHRHIFAGRHRHRAGDQGRYAAEHYIGLRRVRGGDSQDETRSRDDAVVRAENAGAKPADSAQTVALVTSWTHEYPVYTNTEFFASGLA